MKAVLISIQPKWCELIASGEKTIEVRKTHPNRPTPFKCYIYCTKSRVPYESFGVNKRPVECGGYVIGEFECKDVRNYCPDPYGLPEYFISDLKATCLTMEELWSYGKGKELYGWHISDLVIYDEPKPLSEFYGYCGDNPKCDGCKYLWVESNESVGYYEQCCSLLEGCKPLKRPPQSWCYVEGL